MKPSFANARAVVAGIAGYERVRPLPRSVLNDARDVADALRDPTTCGYDPANVATLLEADAGKSGIVSALESAAKTCDADSTFVFYASAHGARLDGAYTGEYLLPFDASGADAEALARTAISSAELADLFGAIRASRFAAIFDCCHAAGVAVAKDDAGAGPVERGLSLQAYARLAVGRGRVVFASCRDAESSYVFGEERNSVFTRHLLEGLRGGAPGPGGVIRIFDLFHYLQPRVHAEVESRGRGRAAQHPVMQCTTEENFPLALHTAGKGTAPPSAQDKASGYDAYVSFAAADEGWVGGTLVPYLESRGLRVVTHDSDPAAVGGFRVESSAQGIERAKRTVVVLSPEFLADRFAAFETLVATHMGVTEARHRLVPLVLRPCERLPLLLDALTSVRCGALGEARALERVARAIAGPVPAMGFRPPRGGEPA